MRITLVSHATTVSIKVRNWQRKTRFCMDGWKDVHFALWAFTLFKDCIVKN